MGRVKMIILRSGRGGSHLGSLGRYSPRSREQSGTIICWNGALALSIEGSGKASSYPCAGHSALAAPPPPPLSNHVQSNAMPEAGNHSFSRLASLSAIGSHSEHIQVANCMQLMRCLFVRPSAPTRRGRTYSEMCNLAGLNYFDCKA